MTVEDDITLHNVPGPTYADLLDSDRFTVPDYLRERAPWPEDLCFEVPRERYLSPEIHQLEETYMWSRTWQMACRTEHLEKPGDSIIYEINGREYIVARVDADTIKAYPNTCLHRGRRLRDGGGRVGRLRCPYHGFAWNLDGQLASVPTAWDFGDRVDPDCMRLPEIAVGVWQGFVFVNADPDCEPLESYVGGLDSHFQRLPLHSWRTAVHAAQVVEANWKVALEAFIEASHVIATHPQTLTGTDPCNSQYDIFDNSVRIITPFGVPSVMVHTEPPPTEQRKMDGMMGRKSTGSRVVEVPEGTRARDMFADIQRGRMHRAGFDGEFSDAEMTDLQTYWLFPNFLVLGAPRATAFRFRPAGPDRCIMEIFGLMPPKPGAEPPPVPEVTWIPEGQGWSSDERLADYALLDQDMSNIPAVQAGLAALKDRPLVLSGYQEAPIAYFHKLLYGHWLGGRA
ncbi:Rieske (2Fe-2S) iron-sulfur domain protein [Mycolicibacterium rhodesiae JS60]|nr:Rieske (2Fe-2S) iron-sulfur domain protein [Mycolicibacterium rhodesiae JS60]